MPRPPEAQPAGHRVAALLGGLAFVAALSYFGLSYTVRFGVGLDPLTSGGVYGPLTIDTALFTTFALHHSLFARSGLKAWVTRVLSPDLERSAYVWLASLLLIAVCAAWQPVPGTLWQLDGLGRDLAIGAEVTAAVLTLVAARQLGVLRLAGIEQIRGGAAAAPVLDDTGLYRLVRHPIYLAWLILVWASPTMTATRAAFAGLSSLYLVLAVPFEERDLHRLFGGAYAAYCRRVRWRMVPFLY